MFTDISQFEAIKWIAVYGKELEKTEAEYTRREKMIDGILAMSVTFFLTTVALVSLRVYGIF